MADESLAVMDVEIRRWVQPLMKVAARLRLTRVAMAIVHRWGLKISEG